ncbi:unnamed protein product [Camellia sinensis]
MHKAKLKLSSPQALHFQHFSWLPNLFSNSHISLYSPQPLLPKPTSSTPKVYQLYGETLEENGIDLAEMKVLRRKMEEHGIDSNLCKPGQYNHLICPMGRRAYPFPSLQMGIELCGPVFEQNVAGEKIQAYVNGNSTSGRIAHIPKFKQTREITEKSLDLEPPCSEVALRLYFAERMISGETLRRSAVMQRRYDDQVHKILN